ncbi:MAG: amino acid permease, partial [Sciscionella sp.]
MVTEPGTRKDSGLLRRVKLFQATTINMSQMCGVGPFITIPAMVVAFGGPQAVIGWVAGALLALLDGLVWAELGASLPGSGGTYVYLREAFQYRSGRLMPFLFVWTATLSIPLIMSTGIVGFVQYLQYLWPGMSAWQGDLVGLA